MAGSFGYHADTLEVSRAMGELSLLPAVRKAPRRCAHCRRRNVLPPSDPRRHWTQGNARGVRAGSQSQKITKGGGRLRRYAFVEVEKKTAGHDLVAWKTSLYRNTSAAICFSYKISCDLIIRLPAIITAHLSCSGAVDNTGGSDISWGVRAMKQFTRLVILACLALTAASIPHAGLAATVDEQFAARLAALEKQNAALRARVSRLEADKAAKLNPVRASVPRPQSADPMSANAGRVAGPLVDQVIGKAAGIPTPYAPPRFELSGSVLFLQPGAGNLEYGTLVTPFPVATPNWSNQSLSPNFSPAFGIGARYMPNAVERYRTELDPSEHHHEWLFFGRGHANGRAALFDRPGIGFVQDRQRRRAVRLRFGQF